MSQKEGKKPKLPEVSKIFNQNFRQSTALVTDKLKEMAEKERVQTGGSWIMAVGFW